jgi:hypothetical protein
MPDDEPLDPDTSALARAAAELVAECDEVAATAGADLLPWDPADVPRGTPSGLLDILRMIRPPARDE